MRWLIAFSIMLLSGMASGCARPAPVVAPLRVVLIPADGGTESGTLADYRPLFDAVARSTGMTFDLKVAQSYNAVVEALCNGTADIAFVGPVTFLQAEHRGCVDLLAVAVKSGASVYRAGIYARQDSPVHDLGDLRGKRVAFGDINSTSAFVYPVAMLLARGIDPATDLAAVRLTGSHANSLAALLAGQVDAAALSFESYEKSVREDVPHAQDVRVLASSDAIPNPPLVMNRALPAATKARLRAGFQAIRRSGVDPALIRGYGGGRVDGYNTRLTLAAFDGPAARMALVDDAIKNRILVKSSER